MYSISPPCYCIDVECAATGKGHNDRTPVRVAMVDENQKVILHEYILPDKSIINYLTELTGVTENDLINAKSLDLVKDEIKKILTSNVHLPILVGASVVSDISWLDLKKDRDFSSSVNISEMFKAYNPRYDQYNYFSLDHICRNASGTSHKPVRLRHIYFRLQAG